MDLATLSGEILNGKLHFLLSWRVMIGDYVYLTIITVEQSYSVVSTVI